MKIAGIIAEYNPFHNGHKYHINKIKESSDEGGNELNKRKNDHYDKNNILLGHIRSN